VECLPFWGWVKIRSIRKSYLGGAEHSHLSKVFEWRSGGNAGGRAIGELTFITAWIANLDPNAGSVLFYPPAQLCNLSLAAFRGGVRNEKWQVAEFISALERRVRRFAIFRPFLR
jgi:hypothetical protein